MHPGRIISFLRKEHKIGHFMLGFIFLIIIIKYEFEIDYLNNKHNLQLPESEEYETIAGLNLIQLDKSKT